MINKILSSLGLLIGILLVSCTEEIPFDKNDNKPTLIMNAVVNATQTNHYVYFALTDQTKPVAVSGDITLSVYVNDVIQETIIAPTTEGRISFPCVLQQGDVLRLEATDIQNHQVSAESIVPQAPNGPLTLRVEDYSWVGDDIEKKGLKYMVSFDDSSSELRYYRLQSLVKIESYTLQGGVKSSIGTPQWANTILIVDDAILSDGHPRSNPDAEDYDLMGTMDYDPNLMGIFDNKRFKNSSCSLSYVIATPQMQDYSSSEVISSGDDTYTSYTTTVSIQKITSAAYRYYQLLNKLKGDNYSEMINEPIEVPSNVLGGTGFVTCINEINATLTTDKAF